MGAVAWGALGIAGVLAATAVALVVWRRRRTGGATGQLVDLVAAEAAERDDDREFDRIIGHLLRTDPAFADSTSRLARHDDTGPAV